MVYSTWNFEALIFCVYNIPFFVMRCRSRSEPAFFLLEPEPTFPILTFTALIKLSTVDIERRSRKFKSGHFKWTTLLFVLLLILYAFLWFTFGWSMLRKIVKDCLWNIFMECMHTAVLCFMGWVYNNTIEECIRQYTAAFTTV